MPIWDTNAANTFSEIKTISDATAANTFNAIGTVWDATAANTWHEVWKSSAVVTIQSLASDIQTTAWSDTGAADINLVLKYPRAYKAAYFRVRAYGWSYDTGLNYEYHMPAYGNIVFSSSLAVSGPAAPNYTSTGHYIMTAGYNGYCAVRFKRSGSSQGSVNLNTAECMSVNLDPVVNAIGRVPTANEVWGWIGSKVFHGNKTIEIPL